MGRLDTVEFLIRDRDAKFSGPLDEVFRTEGMRVILTPVRAPRATPTRNASFEPCEPSAFYHLLFLGRRHLEGVLRGYVAHYNKERPHRGIGLSVPEGLSRDCELVELRDVRRRDIPGGLIHE